MEKLSPTENTIPEASAAQIKYLAAIRDLSTKGPVRSIDLADHLGVSKPSVSRAVKTLELSGFLVKNEDGYLEITASGYSQLNKQKDEEPFDIKVRDGVELTDSMKTYLRAIARLSEEQTEVRAVDIANALNVSKPSVSRALKNLEENGAIINTNGKITIATEESPVTLEGPAVCIDPEPEIEADKLVNTNITSTEERDKMPEILPVPESEQRVLNNLLKNLNEAYPDKVIKNLARDHDHWDENVTRLYKNIGYETRDDFFAAYGFTVERGKQGRPSADLKGIMDEIISRYEGDRYVSSIDQLKEENPDYAPKMKNIINKSKQLFGMTLKKYLVEQGVMKDAGKERIKDFEEKLDKAMTELKARYSDTEEKPASVVELVMLNGDLGINAITKWIKEVHHKPAKDYLIEQGILVEKKKEKKEPTEEQKFKKLSVEEKLAKVIEDLKVKIAAGGKKGKTVPNLVELYPELPTDGTLRKWVKQAYGKQANDYFVEQGILMTEHEKFVDMLEEIGREYVPEDAESEDDRGVTADSGIRFYDNIDKCDVDALLTDNNAGTVDEPVPPKSGTTKIKVDGKTIKIKSRFKSDFDRMDLYEWCKYYDISEVQGSILSTSEVIERLGVYDPSGAKPVIDPDADLKELDKNIIKRRKAFLVGVAHLLNNNSGLAKIAEAAPKKKNGTFHKNRVCRIASTAAASAYFREINDDNNIYEIFAKAEADDTLSLRVKERPVNDDEIDAVYGDYVSQHWKEIGLEKYMVGELGKADDTSAPEEKEKGSSSENIDFRIEGERLFINNPDENQEYIEELKKCDSAVIEGDEIKIRFPWDKFNLSGDNYFFNKEVTDEAVKDMWASMLWFEGLYDYKDWNRKREGWNKKIFYDAATEQWIYIKSGKTVAKNKYNAGNPLFDCRVTGGKKYDLRASVLRLAKCIDEYAEICEAMMNNAAEILKSYTPEYSYADYMCSKNNKSESVYTFPIFHYPRVEARCISASKVAISLHFWR